MNLSIRDTIDELGTTEIARAMRLPISTVHGWKTENAIPGKPDRPLHEFKVRAFRDAVRELKRRQPRKKAA